MKQEPLKLGARWLGDRLGLYRNGHWHLSLDGVYIPTRDF